MTPEGEVKKAVVERLRQDGWVVWKMEDRFTKGRPDLYCFKDNLTLWLEIKAPGKRPEPLQWKRIKELLKNGVPAIYVDAVDYDGYDPRYCLEDVLILMDTWKDEIETIVSVMREWIKDEEENNDVS